MHIGLIGGIGPAATDLYYRGLIDAMKARGQVLDATIVHADAPTLVRNFEARQPEAQAEIFLRLADRLVGAGAKALAITSIGGHFCIEPFRARCPLPIIDMIAEMDRAMAERGLKRVGLIGTDTVMATRFYGGIRAAEVLVPEPDEIARIHRNYVNMALAARVTEEQRQVFFAAGRALAARGAEVLLLGGTDLFLAFDGHEPGFATLDCAGIHIEAIAREACRPD
jgi:aspartate racemase